MLYPGGGLYIGLRSVAQTNPRPCLIRFTMLTFSNISLKIKPLQNVFILVGKNKRKSLIATFTVSPSTAVLRH